MAESTRSNTATLVNLGVVASTDPLEFCSKITEFSGPLLARSLSRGPFFGEVSAARLPGLRLARVRTRNFHISSPTERQLTSITIGLDSAFQIRDKHGQRTSELGWAYVAGDEEQFEFACKSGTMAVINISTELLMKAVTQLSGSRVAGCDYLPRQFSLSDAKGGRFSRTALQLWQDISEKSAHVDPSRFMERSNDLLEQFALIVSSRRSRAMVAESGPSASSGRRRAEEWIASHLTRPVGRAELCAVAGLNVRTLSREFRRAHGQSPIAFVRTRRLEAVHRDLIAAQLGQTTVTEIAMKFGFSHLGRFSRDYWRLFGERPSETLRR